MCILFYLISTKLQSNNTLLFSILEVVPCEFQTLEVCTLKHWFDGQIVDAYCHTVISYMTSHYEFTTIQPL